MGHALALGPHGLVYVGLPLRLAVTSHQSAVATAGTFDYVRMDACPDTWACVGVNSPPQTGTEYYSNGIWSLRGVGAGQHQYVWQAANGDSGLSARLTGQVDTEANAQAGLMYRGLYNGGNGGAPFYLVATEPNHGLLVAARATDNGSNVTLATSPTATLPLYLQVVRAGDTFTAYTSPDDASWAPLPGSSVAIDAITDTAELGLFVNSGDATSASTALFDTADLTGTTAAAPAVGTDLVNLDTHTEHYTQLANGLVDLHLYNSPVGIPDVNGWQQRDTSLISTTGMITAANVPFRDTIAPNTSGLTSTTGMTSSPPSLALLTGEDGVTLSVGLTGTTPLTTGVVSGNAVTYTQAITSNTTPPPPSSDFSLRSTVAGLDARIVIHSASERGPFQITLASSPNTQFTQQSDGTIQATQNVTGYEDDGVTPYTTAQVEYTVQTPLLVDSSTAVTAPISTGPATATLTSTVPGTQTVSLSVDPTWLNDPGRHFPATLDVPIDTAYSDANTGLFGTTKSCAPDQPAAPTEVIVGAINGCTYNGQAYVDVSALPISTTILTATLRMYTPNQMTSTGVQVYQNAPPAEGDDPSTPPTWNTAPVVMTGTSGIAQTASDGHWQSWDVTGLVQGWAQDSATNGGLRFMSTGAPVSFASPLGAGTDAPSDAPYLDIIYDPNAHRGGGGGASGPYYDETRNIYGVSGSYSLGKHNCASRNLADCGDIKVDAVSGNGGRGGLGASLLRVGIQVQCTVNGQPSDSPSASYWTTSLTGTNPSAANAGNWDSIPNILSEAYKDGLTPILTIEIPDGDNNCATLLGNPGSNPLLKQHWGNEMKSLVDTVVQPLARQFNDRFMYFEIGNEQNVHRGDYWVSFNRSNGTDTFNYPGVFAAAAKGLRDEIQALGLHLIYRVLTTGMVEPTADSRQKPAQPHDPHGAKVPVCIDPSVDTKDGEPPFTNESVAAKAIKEAESTDPAGNPMPPLELGFAVHPYDYTTVTRGPFADPHHSPTSTEPYWDNFYHMYPYPLQTKTSPTPVYEYNNYAGTCRDLKAMVRTWLLDASHASTPYGSIAKQQLPLVFTEDNWDNHPEFLSDGRSKWCGERTGCEGAYLADLFTWLYDHNYASSKSLSNPLQFDTEFSPVRFAWYRGADGLADYSQDLYGGPNPYLGVYDLSGGVKRLNGGSQAMKDRLDHCALTHANTLNELFQRLIHATCY